MENKNYKAMLEIDDKNLTRQADQKKNIAQKKSKTLLCLIVVSVSCCFMDEVYSNEFLQQKRSFRRESTHKKPDKKTFLTEMEKIKLVETGVYDKDNQGNVLALDWHSNGTMLLVSQIYPNLWQKAGKDTYLKQAIEELKTRGKIIKVRTGLDWIAKLGKEDTEEQEIKKTIEWLSLADINEFDHNRVARKNGLLGFIKGFIRYLDELKDIVTEKNVYRPAKKEEKNIQGGCVTDEIGWDETKKVLEEMEGRLSNQKVLKRGDLHKIYYKLRVIAGLANSKELNDAIENKIVPDSLIIVRDYVNHATHTEAQMIVAKKILKDHLIEKCSLISTKLPCWSCLRIPSLTKNDFKALRLGINDYELQEYPADIKLSDGGLSSKSLKGREPIAVHLELLRPLDSESAEYFGAGRRGLTMAEETEQKSRIIKNEIIVKKEQKEDKKYLDRLSRGLEVDTVANE